MWVECFCSTNTSAKPTSPLLPGRIMLGVVGCTAQNIHFSVNHFISSVFFDHGLFPTEPYNAPKHRSV